MSQAKKIALIDNMNNNFFALARYLRDLGHEADLYLIPNNSMVHFHPQRDTWIDISQVEWIKRFPIDYGSLSYLPFRDKLRNAFNSYDIIVACGDAVGLLQQARIKIDLFVPYGSDLYHTPFIERYEKRLSGLLGWVQYFFDRRRSTLQSAGIQQSRFIICNNNWELAKISLDRLGSIAHNLPRVMVYLEDNAPPDLELNVSDDNDFVVFSPTRHMWCTNADKLPDFDVNGGTKRNDKLIRAFARLVKMGVYKAPQLWMCDYGQDVDASKQLIETLGISQNVIWFPLMDRRELLEYAKQATFIADQFRQTMSATSAGTTNEALAIGVPVIANADGAIADENDPYYDAPILQALEEDEILDHLLLHSRDYKAYETVAREGALFFEKNLGLGLTKKYLELLTEKLER